MTKQIKSVDWLIERLKLHFGESITKIMKEDFHDAKQLNEFEIRHAYNMGKITVLDKSNKTSEEYINENF